MTKSILHKAAKKEQFSYAFLHAVASNANLTVSAVDVDHDSIDCMVFARGRIGRLISPCLFVQLKATSRNLVRGSQVHFPLSIKNYNELKDPDANAQVPRILAVLTLPPDPSPWLYQNSEQLTLMRCAYWRSLEGEPDTTNTDSVTVHIPTKKRLTTRSLSAIMQRVGERRSLA